MHLKVEHLNDILTELLPCAVKWEGLGLKFGLTDDDLAPIKRMCRGDDKEALKQMLVEVLHRMKITWKTIVAAVRSVGRNDVADAIIENKQLTAEPVAGKQQRPDDFARASPAKVKKLTESSTEPLANIANKVPHTDSTINIPQIPIDTDNSNTQVAKVLYEEVCAQPTVKDTDIDFDQGEGTLERETEHMRRMFAGLICEVINSIKKAKVEVKTLSTFLQQIEPIEAALVKARCSSLVFTAEVVQSIENGDIDNVFNRELKHYYSWFNFDLIEDIIKEFCKKDDDVKEKLTKYKKKMKKYCKNRLCQFPNTRDRFGEYNVNTKLCVFKIDKKWSTMRFSELNIIKSIICDVLKLKQVVLFLQAVGKGCVELTFSIPKRVAELVFPPLSAQVEELEKQGIRFCDKSSLPFETLKKKMKLSENSSRSSGLLQSVEGSKGKTSQSSHVLKSITKRPRSNSPSATREWDLLKEVKKPKLQGSSPDAGNTNTDDEVYLGIEDLDEILSTTHPYASQWSALGLKLTDDIQKKKCLHPLEESFDKEAVEEEKGAATQGLDQSQHGLQLDYQSSRGDTTTPTVASASENTEMDSFQSHEQVFPREVLENIFCRLSLVDLYTSTRRVCRDWNEIITAEGFIKWKKLYYKTKHDPEKIPSEIKFSHDSSLLDIARYVNREFSSRLINTSLEPLLRKHPQYSCVSGLAKQHQTENTDTLSDLEELVLLVTCCRSVHQLIDLVHLLTCPIKGGLSSPAFSYMEISEIFYCLATIFRIVQPDLKIPSRFHYYLYYVLDVLERRAAVHVELDEPDGVTASAAKLTSEQLRIVNHKFEPGHTVKVIALAGTGKTTTLYHIARSNPRLKFLYCVYNKSVQQHAEKTIFADCDNVDAKTFHSLAFMKTGLSYAKRGKLGSSLYAMYISWKIKSRANKLGLANCVRDTLNNYLASADEEITLEHVVSINKNDNASFPNDVVLSEAKQYWDLMKSLDDENAKKVGITHDGYLKLYQLMKPANLSNEYDIILVDEAQDLSPVIIDILSCQKTAKVFVGDPNQQIYSFRGATNALKQITATYTYSLTRSFRFGPEISYACELALSYFQPHKTQILIGTTAKDFIDGKTRTGQEAIICRLNSTLFDEVVKVLKDRPGARIGFAGTAKMPDLDSKYNFDSIEDIAALKAGADVRSLKTDIKWHYNSYGDLCTKAMMSGDKPLIGRIKVVKEYGDQIPSLMNRIREAVTFKLESADVMFSSAHRSKGLEFETVIVADDFTTGFVKSSVKEAIEIEVNEDERNLVYVAMSRAKKNLVLSKAIWKIFPKNEFLFPATSAEVCASCKRNSPFMLEQSPFHLSDGPEIPQQNLCRECGSNNYY